MYYCSSDDEFVEKRLSKQKQESMSSSEDEFEKEMQMELENVMRSYENDLGENHSSMPAIKLKIIHFF